jgi:hypothetical protein
MGTVAKILKTEARGEQHRRELARSWLRVVDLARHPAPGLSARIPICRDRVNAAQAEIAGLVNLLTAQAPNPGYVTEVAEALLVDGTGPLFNRRSGSDLAESIRQALDVASSPSNVDHRQPR